MNEGATTDESTTEPQFTAIEMDARANTASVSTGAANGASNGASKNAAQRDMERYLEWVDETQDVLDKIRDVVHRVKQRHDLLLSLPPTASDTERDHLSNELDEFMADVKRNATRVRQKIARMTHLPLCSVLCALSSELSFFLSSLLKCLSLSCVCSAELNGLIQKDQRAPPESVNQANLRIKQAQVCRIRLLHFATSCSVGSLPLVSLLYKYTMSSIARAARRLIALLHRHHAGVLQRTGLLPRSQEGAPPTSTCH